MSKTASEQLSAVQDAIHAILSGGAVKAYTIAGRTLDKYSIKELRELEKSYQAQVNAQTRGSKTNLVRFDDL